MILNSPPFTALRPRIGQMTAMTPGFYENGSVYVHGNCFWIQALAVAGRGQEAWDAIRGHPAGYAATSRTPIPSRS